MSSIIQLKGMGLASSLGLSARSACAAARAGINRMGPVDYFDTYNEMENKSEPIKGCPIGKFTDGFAGVGRLLRMSYAAIDDLTSGIKLNRSELHKTALFLHVSDRFYNLAALVAELEEDGEVEEEVIETVFAMGLEDQEEYNKAIEQKLLAVLGDYLGIEKSNLFATYGGPAAFLHTLQMAQEYLDSGSVSACIVGAADSLLDTPVLDAMYQLKILNCSEYPTGFVPGECASFLLIENDGSSITEGAKTLGRIHGISVTKEPNNLLYGTPDFGTTLAESITQSINTIQTELKIRMFIGNACGDSYRTPDYMSALNKLKQLGITDSIKQRFPGSQFGDTGCAFTPLSICIGASAFERNYAGGDGLLLWAISDNGERSSCFMQTA